MKLVYLRTRRLVFELIKQGSFLRLRQLILKRILFSLFFRHAHASFCCVCFLKVNYTGKIILSSGTLYREQIFNIISYFGELSPRSQFMIVDLLTPSAFPAWSCVISALTLAAFSDTL